MYQTWLNALNDYEYPKTKYDIPRDLSDLSGAFFLKDSYSGKRGATISFEDYFRNLAEYEPAVWQEVALWKLYSQLTSRNRPLWKTVRQIRCKVRSPDHCRLLWESIQRFDRSDNKDDQKAALLELMGKLGLTSNRIALALTFVAFSMPSSYPMIDTRVGDWINANQQRTTKKPFRSIARGERSIRKNTSITVSDFEAYLCWAKWCRDMARRLSIHVPIEPQWRPRDVEMAVYTAEEQGLPLELP